MSTLTTIVTAPETKTAAKMFKITTGMDDYLRQRASELGISQGEYLRALVAWEMTTGIFPGSDRS